MIVHVVFLSFSYFTGSHCAMVQTSYCHSCPFLLKLKWLFIFILYSFGNEELIRPHKVNNMFLVLYIFENWPGHHAGFLFLFFFNLVIEKGIHANIIFLNLWTDAIMIQQCWIETSWKMIQTYTAQLDGECMSVWNQTASSSTITQWLCMCSCWKHMLYLIFYNILVRVNLNPAC